MFRCAKHKTFYHEVYYIWLGLHVRGPICKTSPNSNQQQNYVMPPETEMNVGSCIKLVRLFPNRVALKKKKKILYL